MKGNSNLTIGFEIDIQPVFPMNSEQEPDNSYAEIVNRIIERIHSSDMFPSFRKRTRISKTGKNELFVAHPDGTIIGFSRDENCVEIQTLPFIATADTIPEIATALYETVACAGSLLMFAGIDNALLPYSLPDHRATGFQVNLSGHVLKDPVFHALFYRTLALFALCNNSVSYLPNTRSLRLRFLSKIISDLLTTDTQFPVILSSRKEQRGNRVDISMLAIEFPHTMNVFMRMLHLFVSLNEFALSGGTHLFPVLGDDLPGFIETVKAANSYDIEACRTIDRITRNTFPESIHSLIGASSLYDTPSIPGINEYYAPLLLNNYLKNNEKLSHGSSALLLDRIVSPQGKFIIEMFTHPCKHEIHDIDWECMTIRKNDDLLLIHRQDKGIDLDFDECIYNRLQLFFNEYPEKDAFSDRAWELLLQLVKGKTTVTLQLNNSASFIYPSELIEIIGFLSRLCDVKKLASGSQKPFEIDISSFDSHFWFSGGFDKYLKHNLLNILHPLFRHIFKWHHTSVIPSRIIIPGDIPIPEEIKCKYPITNGDCNRILIYEAEYLFSASSLFALQTAIKNYEPDNKNIIMNRQLILSILNSLTASELSRENESIFIV